MGLNKRIKFSKFKVQSSPRRPLGYGAQAECSWWIIITTTPSCCRDTATIHPFFHKEGECPSSCVIFDMWFWKWRDSQSIYLCGAIFRRLRMIIVMPMRCWRVLLQHWIYYRVFILSQPISQLVQCRGPWFRPIVRLNRQWTRADEMFEINCQTRPI